MSKLTVSIDAIHGDVKILMADGKERQEFELKWCEFDEAGSTGFITSFTPAPVLITEVAAEHFLRLVVSALVRTFELKPGDLTIINYMGERLSDVQFCPPTFDGNEAELVAFVAKQDSLLKLHSMYEQFGKLDESVIELAASEDIVDDFLSLVQVRASGIFLAVNQPSQ